jgi:hypothetical protein
MLTGGWIPHCGEPAASIFNMEADDSFEVLVSTYQIAWYHLPEEATRLHGITYLKAIFFFLGETESTWYVGHHLAYCTNPG